MGAAALRYLSSADVVAAMPPIDERIELARRTMVALVDSAELPPKLGVHPRQPGSLAHAMPALLRGNSADGAQDLVGVKWVSAFPGNSTVGVAAVSALVVLNDPATGVPLAILDGAPITAQRTAAVSGVALREWWPALEGTARVALVGAGVQGQAHVDVLAHVMPGCALTVVDRHPERAQALAQRALGARAFAAVATSDDPDACIASADVVLTMISFGAQRQSVPAAAFARARLIVSVDYDMCVPASVVAGSRTFLTDDAGQFAATRGDVVFRGYPAPDASMGEALMGKAPPPRDHGPVVVNHLGVGLADVVFADAIMRRAQAMNLGVELPR